MSNLYFKIGADYDNVIRLRDEIAKLKRELLSMNQAANPQEFARLENQLRQTSQEFNNLVRQAALAAAQMQNTTVNINHTTSSIGGMDSALAKIGGSAVLAKLASDIIAVRGEFQKTQIAFETMLGSKDKADALMEQMVQTAAKTPFDLQGVANGAKQLLAYGTEAEDVNDTLIRLGNIASGLSIPLGDMVYLYGTTQTQGRLFTQDVRQFMGRGIPLTKELASMLGKTEQEINKMVTAGQIGFPQVEAVIKKMTDSGGQFYNLMEKQSQTLSGQISNLGDAWDGMLNKIGESTEGLSSGTISLATTAVEHYEKVGRILIGLIGTYGSYKAAVIAVSMIESMRYQATLAMGAAEKTLSAWQAIRFATTQKLTAAQALLNKTMLNNPLVLVTSLVVGAAAAMWILADHTSAAEKAQDSYNKKVKDANDTEQNRKKVLEGLISELENECTADTRRIEILDQINAQYPSIFQKYIDEKGHVKDLIALWKEYNEEVSKGKVKQNKQNVSELRQNIEEYKKMIALWSKLGSQNPYFHKGALSDDEKLLADKYKDEEWASLHDKLRTSQQELWKYEKDVREDAFTQWQLDLKKLTDKQIQASREVFIRRIKASSGNKYLIEELNKRVQVIDSELGTRKKKDDSDVKNKEFWSGQKKNADAALDAIDSKQRDLLNATAKDPKKDLYGLGIDKSIVDSYKQAIKHKSEAENELKVYDDPSKQENAAAKKAEDLRQQQEKYNLLLDKQKLDRIRSEQDSANEIEQANINGLQEGSEKTLRQRALNHKKELEAIQREAADKKREIIEKERGRFDTEEELNAKQIKDYTKKTFNADAFAKSESAQKQFKPITEVTEAKTEAENTKYNRGDDFKGLLDEYQDYTNQRLAIETKFNKDIATLNDQREVAVKNGDTKQVEQIDRAKAQATKDKGMKLMSMDYEKLKESPDYVHAFENLKETSSETLNSLLSQLENAKSAAAQVLSPDQLREYTTTIQEIMDELDSRNPFQALSDKKQELADAEQALADAQLALETARQTADAVKGGAKIENGVSSSKFNSKTGKIDSTKSYLSEEQALAKVKEKIDNYNAAKDNAVKKSAKVRKSEKEVRDVIDDLSKSISDVGNSIGGPAGEIISLIGNIGSFAMMAMSGVETASKTTSTAIQTVEKASVILAIISAAIQIATKMLDLFGGDDTTEKYEKTKETYESYINILDQVIDKQLEMAESLSGASAQAAYDKAIELVKTQSEAARVLGRQYLNSGASWKTHSKGYEEVEDMSSDGWNDAAKALGMSVDQFKNKMGGRMDGLFSLSDEQLAKLQGEAHIFWAQLDDDTQDYANQIAEGVSKVQEVLEQRMADTTLIDVDTLRSDFHDLLTDMDADTADFAGNFEEYMKNAILNSMLKDSYMGRLEEWRKKFYKAMDGGMDEREYEALKTEGQQISEEMKAERDKLKDMFGWTGEDSSSSQNSTKGGFETMSQETGTELNGRFTALQIAGEEIKNQSILQTGLLTSINEKMSLADLTNENIPLLMNAANSAIPNVAEKSKEIISNSYNSQINVVFPDAKIDALTAEVSTLKGIVDEMRTLQVNGNLDRMTASDKASAIVKPIQQMQKDMAEVKKNTSKL